MRAVLFSAALLTVLEFVTAQPHGLRHRHHNKRVEGVEVVYTTVTAPEVVVIVDQNGVPYSTFTEGVTPTPASTTIVQTNIDPVADNVATSKTSTIKPSSSTTAHSYGSSSSSSSSSAAAITTTKRISLVTTTTTATKQSTSASASPSSSSSGYGICYDPYHGDGSCKTQSEISSDFQIITGFSTVRIYGTDCNQVELVLTAAKAKGMKVMVGIYDLSTLSSEISTVVSACSNDWDLIETVSIGNELVNSGSATVAEVVAAIGSARTQLQAGGYTGPVVTVDTFVALMNNPQLCEASDFAAANCHPFFDGGVSADKAGSWVKTQAANVAAACPGKQVVITESGWPSGGSSNGQGVPSPANQQTAVSALKSAFASDPENIYIFEAFNDEWKQLTSSTFNAERAWGIYGDSPN